MTTGWYVFSGSLQPNHLSDINLAVLAAYVSGVEGNNIHVFLPHLENDQIEGLRESLTWRNQRPNIHHIDTYAAIIANHQFEKLMAIVTGHGNKEGIATGVGFLAPFTFVRDLRAITGLTQCAIVLGQCFAGVFNYLDIRGAPNTAIFGATALDSSLNWEIDGEWKNVYLHFFLHWIANPVDLDGDQIFTLLDAHRFAGSEVVNKLHDLRFELYVQSESIKESLKILQVLGENQARLAAMRSQLKQHLEVIHTIQNPWILHPDGARRMVVEVPDLFNVQGDEAEDV